MNRSELKESAKKSLKGKYGDIIIMLIIVGLIGAVAAGVGAFLDNILGIAPKTVIDFGIIKYEQVSTGPIGAVLSMVATGVMGFGIVEYFLNISRGKDVNWKDIFQLLHKY